MFFWHANFMYKLSIVLSVFILTGLLIFISLIAPLSFEDRWQEIEIPEGVTYTEGINILKKNGIIKSPLKFLLLGRITMSDRDLKPGYYSLSRSMSPLQIFTSLIEGRTIVYTVTIPEGTSLKGIKRKFRNTGLFDDESWKLAEDRNFLDSLNIDAPSLEGYLYPDTYNFAKGTKPETIFKMMVYRMREKFDRPLRQRAKVIGMSEREVLTLASIIEKEAVFNRERPVISAVYHNRLKKNMKLQADPTVLYGVDTRRKRIRYRDLRRVTPYNTYVINGLPPGPIASPGIRSINAALYPSNVGYMYFVSMNNGSHYFSNTGKEHLEAVRIYQQNGRSRSDGKKKIN